MKVTEKHLLDTATLRLIGSGMGGRAMPVRRCIVIHYTEGGSAASSIEWWQKQAQRAQDLGAHLIIERDGTIYQCRRFDRTISHAGVSRWRDPKTGKVYRFANSFAIGIELANTGDACGVIRGEEHLPGYAGTITAAHRKGGKARAWEKFSAAQIAACTAVCQTLVARYRLDDITGHDCIAPERKDDPGPAFPMLQLRQACGFSGLPEIRYAD